MSEQMPPIPARELAKRAGVPASVLSFFEDQFAQIRSVKTSAGDGYRPRDAALIAGLAHALYVEGRPMREVQNAARSAERDSLVARGAEILGLSLEKERHDAAAPVPPDAQVLRRSAAPILSDPPDAPAKAEILNELIVCVRILSEARERDEHAANRPR
ncbi:MAG: MerR family transcriptional regulator [Pseudomonadota bacterium]